MLKKQETNIKTKTNATTKVALVISAAAVLSSAFFVVMGVISKTEVAKLSQTQTQTIVYQPTDKIDGEIVSVIKDAFKVDLPSVLTANQLRTTLRDNENRQGELVSGPSAGSCCKWPDNRGFKQVLGEGSSCSGKCGFEHYERLVDGVYVTIEWADKDSGATVLVNGTKVK